MHNPARIARGEPQPKPGMRSRGTTPINIMTSQGNRLKTRPIFPNMVTFNFILTFVPVLDFKQD